ncbi:MAG: 3-oxoadipate enol-lactonase [Candidatus Binatia bacterium]
MPFLNLGNCVHHYRVDGSPDKPALVFSNSLGSDLRIWDPLVPYLVGDFRLIRYDTRGHGLSEGLPPPYTAGDLAGDIVGLLDQLEIREAVVCGLSVGGVIAQQLAIGYPERVRALVLCDTGARIGTVASWEERIATIKANGLGVLAQPSMERWFSEEFRRLHPAEVRGYANMVVRTAVDGYAGTCCALRDTDLTKAAANIDKPTLVLCGDQDIATPPEMARELANIVPNARLALIPGAGHISCVEQPGNVATQIRQFLREVQIG